MSKQNLQKLGLKATTPRLKILHLLENSVGEHRNAEQVHQELAAMGVEIGLATVYRVLTQFEAAGLVKRLNFEGEHALFELNQGVHHDHLVCVKCNKIEEFIDPIIEERQQIIAKQAGFQMTDHSLNIFGICYKCNRAAH